jgi:hypothetical protein
MVAMNPILRGYEFLKARVILAAELLHGLAEAPPASSG